MTSTLRKTSTALMLSAGIALSGCAGVTPGSVGSITTTLLQEVEAVVATTCGAVPEAAAVIALLNAGVATTAAGLASAFCSAFSSAVPVTPTKASLAFRARARAAGIASPQRYCAGSVCGWR